MKYLALIVTVVSIVLLTAVINRNHVINDLRYEINEKDSIIKNQQYYIVQLTYQHEDDDALAIEEGD